MKTGKSTLAKIANDLKINDEFQNFPVLQCDIDFLKKEWSLNENAARKLLIAFSLSWPQLESRQYPLLEKFSKKGQQ